MRLMSDRAKSKELRDVAANSLRNSAIALLLFSFAFTQSGCDRKGQFQAISMWNESRLKPYEPGQGLDGVGARRQIPVGTVAQGDIVPQTARTADNKLTTQFPFPVTKAVLERGQERYNVYCAPCHGLVGNGEGVVAKRGFPHPPDYALKRLREAPVGHFYEVITYGYGIMYPYADRVPSNDRWAIAAYIRALQAARKEVVPQDQWLTERVRARQLGVPRRGGTMTPTVAPAGENAVPAHGTNPSTIDQPVGNNQEAPATGGSPEHSAPGAGAAPAPGGAPATGESNGHG
jgi:mono/diheme cytochrome c family protein